MGARFGTDGIRGVANAELTPELALALGRAVARVLPASCFVVGRDTRRSGPLLHAALSSGMAAEGADVLDVGVLPTPGVAWVAQSRELPGAMVSASHNPFEDNGVKIFAVGGLKLPDALEEAVEAELSSLLDGEERGPRPPTGPGVGHIRSDPAVATGYLEHLEAALEGRRLEGLHVVVDCANGAGSEVAPALFGRLGARVDALFCEPDGANINNGCGSMHPEQLAKEVVDAGADIGIALDGDADRCLVVDATGVLHGGDEMLALFAADLAERGRLAGDTVVATVMSNLGLHLAMARDGITVRTTQVGDRYVLEALDAESLSLGGEQSGHVIFRELATTGDGVLTGLLLADLVCRRGEPLAELAPKAMERVPQRLENVPAADPELVVAASVVREMLEEVEAELGGTGRVLLRASGTEPLVRVMVEAKDAVVADQAVRRLVAVVREAAGIVPPASASDAPVGVEGS